MNPGSPCLQRMQVLETKDRLIISGGDAARKRYRILLIDRSYSNELRIWEDTTGADLGLERVNSAPDTGAAAAVAAAAAAAAEHKEDTVCFSASACVARLDVLVTQYGPVSRRTRIYGIMGALRLPRVYLFVITQRRLVGDIGGRRIYGIAGTMLIPVCSSKSGPNKPHSSDHKYRQLISSIDFSKDFYFSYFYDLTRSMQDNVLASESFQGSSWVTNTRTRDRTSASATIAGAAAAAASAPTPAPASPKQSSNTSSLEYSSQFTWNLHMARVLMQALNASVDSIPLASSWIVPVICGYFSQATFVIESKEVVLSLIARRSRFYAGTRYLKRGISSFGHVANEVETEQLVHVRGAFIHGGGSFSSFVMMRGSIPLFWSQDSPKSPKPDIHLHHHDAQWRATERHFRRLLRRYWGGPIQILNLIKQTEKQPKESKLGRAFAQAVSAVGPRLRTATTVDDAQATAVGDAAKVVGTSPIPMVASGAAPSQDPNRNRLTYLTYDFLNNRLAKRNVQVDLRRIVGNAVQEVGFFLRMASSSSAASTSQLQTGARNQLGVCRVNCIDCLDRTNVAQFVVAKLALKSQLRAMGIMGEKQERLFPEITAAMQTSFTEHGDRIAHQYAGSGAMHKEALLESDGSDGNAGRAQKKGKSRAANAFSAVKRYVANNLTDVDKQLAINVVLGGYIPDPGSKPAIWDLDPNSNHKDSDQLFRGHHYVKFGPPFNPALLLHTSSVQTKSASSATAQLTRTLARQHCDEAYDAGEMSSFDAVLSAEHSVRRVVNGSASELIVRSRSGLRDIAASTLNLSPSLSSMPSVSELDDEDEEDEPYVLVDEELKEPSRSSRRSSPMPPSATPPVNVFKKSVQQPAAPIPDNVPVVTPEALASNAGHDNSSSVLTDQELRALVAAGVPARDISTYHDFKEYLDLGSMGCLFDSIGTFRMDVLKAKCGPSTITTPEVEVASNDEQLRDPEAGAASVTQDEQPAAQKNHAWMEHRRARLRGHSRTSSMHWESPI